MRYRSRKKFALGATAMVMALAAGSVALTVTESSVSAAPVTLTFLSFNDFHGRINQATGANPNTAKFATTIENLRLAAPGGEANTLLVSAGDNFGASEFASSSANDQPTIDVLKALDVSASSVGNHEFDKGFSDLKDRVINGANGVDFPYLGANVYAKGTTGPALLQEYAIFDMGGIKVGVVGAVTIETPALVSPLGVASLDFGDPVVAVNRVADQLTDGNAANGEAQIIIAAFHEGSPVTTSVADGVAASSTFANIVNNTSAKVDVIFNGHTHQAYAFDTSIPSSASTRPLVQTGSYGANIGKVEVTYEPDTDTVSTYTRAVVPTKDTVVNLALPRVAAVNTIVTNALAAAAVIGNVPVATVSADITTAWKSGGYTGPNGTFVSANVPVDRDNRSKESSLGNLVADALLDTLDDVQYGSATIGVVNPGGLRNELYYAPDGVITYGEANAVLPFVNNLWTTSLTGVKFKQMLEEQWQRTSPVVSGTNPIPNNPLGTYLQLGLSDNVTYTFDEGRALNDRITSIVIDGVPIDPAASYRIGTFSFLATGGDNFYAFQSGTAVRDTGLIDRDGWIKYLTANSPVSPDFARQAVAAGALPTSAVAGSNIALSLSALNLTSLGSPQNTSVEVFLGGIDIGSTPVAADGSVSINLPVPNTVPAGQQPLQVVAQPSNTTVTIPVTVTSTTPSKPYKPLIFSQEPPASIQVVRLADSREGVGFAKAPLVQGNEYQLVVAGKSGVPATAKAVAVNVTALNSTVDGFINVYPCGTSATNPLASVLNQVPGKIVANLAIVDIGAGGAICLRTNTATDVVVDLQTYYRANSDLESLTPVRLVDTRTAVGLPSKLSANVPVALKVAGLDGVPADASSVVLNITSTESPAGYITAYPCGTEPPLASNLNTWEGHAIANLAVVGVGANGEICFRSSNTTHLVIDLQGYFGAGADYNAMTPVRALDTRVTQKPLESNVFREIPIAGLYGVPKIADQVTVNVTAVGATGPAFITVYPCGALPFVSSGNASPDRIVATLAVVDLSKTGSICVLSNLKTDLVVDVQGWAG
ncbi:MAG: bifunctional UDP-sugar hydrolase/5'-nucleotidase [Ilumatobacteraceae bacterium]